MIEIIKLTDKNSKILFENEKYSVNKREKLTDKGPEKKIFVRQLLKKPKKLFLKKKTE